MERNSTSRFSEVQSDVQPDNSAFLNRLNPTTWTLSTKIVVLFVVPVVFYVLFLAALFLQIDQIQSLVQRQHDEQKLILQLDQILFDKGMSFAGSLERSVLSVNFSEKDKIEKQSRIKSHIDLARHNPVLDQDTARLVELVERSYQNEPNRPIEFNEIGMFQTMQLMHGEADTLQRLRLRISENLSTNAQTQKREQASRNQLKTIILLGIFLNIILAAVTLVFFVRDLQVSLRRLTENSKSISCNTSLPYTVKRNDELGKIDSALHDSHNHLKTEKEQRESINAMIAHDIRSPLASVRLLIESLLAIVQANENPKVIQKIQSLNDNIETVYMHVEDLLMVERLEKGMLVLALNEFDISALVLDVCMSFDEFAKAKDIKIVYRSATLPVIADRARIKQVVQNYVSNAIKYSPCDSQIVISATKTEDYVMVRVEDYGVGISLADQSQLFQKFFRAGDESAEHGFGVGLAICQMVIKAHGGEVGVTSRPRQGSVFWFTLPVDSDELFL